MRSPGLSKILTCVAGARGVSPPSSTGFLSLMKRGHSGDVFETLRCDCAGQLERAMELVNTGGAGIIRPMCYLRTKQEKMGHLLTISGVKTADYGMHNTLPL